MSETQPYKFYQLTVPASAAECVRLMFEDRLATVRKALDDPLVNRTFSRRDLEKLAFEALELAKMIHRMPEAANA